jgi:Archaeal holliday junction resolvase (hjc)
VVRGAGYERELRALLEGDPGMLARYARALPPEDRKVVERLARTPFLVVRAAGSFGFDLVALRSEFSFPLEVKASRETTIRFSAASGRAHAQLAEHTKAVNRVGLVVVYAYRRIGGGRGDPWRVYVAQGPDGAGWRRVVRRRVPLVESTRDGNGILRWASGMPLVRFLDLVTSLAEPVHEGPP